MVDIPGFDPSILSRPLNELALDNKEVEGIQVTGADALLQEKTEAAADAVSEPEGEGKVSYSRFKKFHDLAKEAQMEAEYWKNKAMEPQSRPEPNYYSPPAPNQYVEPQFQGADWERFKALFQGADENAVKEAYRLEVQRIAAVEERAIQRAADVFEQRTQQQRQEYRTNRASLDEWTEEASELIGRNLTDDEQIALLDIADEFSVKDNEGRIEALMNPEQALRIYQMQNSAHSQRREVRNAIAAASSSSSGGDTTVVPQAAENNQKFNAQLGWRANFRNLTGRDPNKT